jgi:hypothetical protein
MQAIGCSACENCGAQNLTEVWVENAYELEQAAIEQSWWRSATVAESSDPGATRVMTTCEARERLLWDRGVHE